VSERLLEREIESFFRAYQGAFYEDLEVLKLKYVWYPWREKKSTEIVALTPALIAQIKNVEKDTIHYVIIAINPDTHQLDEFCGDILLTNSEKYEKERDEIYREYQKLLKEKEIDEHSIPEEWIGTGNWCRTWKFCKHFEHLRTLLDAGQVKQGFSLLLNSVEEEKKEEEGFETKLKKFAFKVPVLLEGEQGSGKTHTAFKVAQEIAKEIGAEIVIGQGDNSIEATDLLGYWIKDQSGNLVWKDGVLTEAFRKAQKGKVILIFDEFYRLRDREKDIFVRALTVFPDGKLKLRTGRVIKVEDGIAQEEVLEIPKENLWVIATTNVGTQFDVDEADPALQERFIILRKDTTEKELKEILKKKVKEKRFSQELVEKLIRFWKGARKLWKSGELSGFPTTRTLVRAIELAQEEEEVKEYLWEQRYIWIGRDSFGYPIPEQEDTLKELLDSIF